MEKIREQRDLNGNFRILGYECPECVDKIRYEQGYCSECGEPLEWDEDNWEYVLIHTSERIPAEKKLVETKGVRLVSVLVT